MRRKLKGCVLFFAGVLATLFVQWLLAPWHQEMAAVKSPDGSLLFVVDRYDPGLMGLLSLKIPWRTFTIYRLGTDGERLMTDGAIYRVVEPESGGMDMTNMRIYWQGGTAVADFSGLRLERTWPEDNWRWVGKISSTAPSNAPMPASAP